MDGLITMDVEREASGEEVAFWIRDPNRKGVFNLPTDKLLPLNMPEFMAYFRSAWDCGDSVDWEQTDCFCRKYSCISTSMRRFCN